MTNCSERTHNPFRFTHFRKNASVNPLVSHTFKTKDLKPFRFIHFQKKVGVGYLGVSLSDFQLPTSDLFFSLSALTSTLTDFASATPLTSTLTKTKDLKSFNINTYKKGVGGTLFFHWTQVSSHRRFYVLWTFNCRLSTVTCHLPTHPVLFPFPSGRGRRLFSWPSRSRWKESRALLRFEQASPATGRSGSSRRRSRDWRRGVCGNALRRPRHRRSSHIPSPGRSGKRRLRVWRRRTLRVSGGASWPVGA
jgi:hypothetical protein